MAHHQRDLINKDEADHLKIPVHGPPSAVASAGLPSPLALPPPAVHATCSPSSASSRLVSPRTANAAPVLHLTDPAPVDLSPATAPAVVVPSSTGPSRCASCRKRVGLAGFRCRCDGLFCGTHRYSDRHACTFDYKAQAREAIARDNPVYKAPKLLRI